MTALLAIGLALSWLWFWTVESRPQLGTTVVTESAPHDTVTVWISELLGSPDEAHYYALADLWNAVNPGVYLKMAVMSHAGYESKLRIAMASGQPPDVCVSTMESLEQLQFAGKSDDQVVSIPEAYFPKELLDALGPAAANSTLRDGRPLVFPIWRYAYGGVLLADHGRLSDAGYDDATIREKGWTFDEFRDACRKMTRDTDGDGRIDVWGFAASRTHFKHLFLNEFGPAVWGKGPTERWLLGYNAKSGHWGVHPGLSELQIEQVFALFNQLINEDKTWNPSSLGMEWADIIKDLVVRRRVGLIFGETPWVATLQLGIWETDRKLGAVPDGPPPDLAVVWMPTLRAGERPAPRAGVYGLSVMKQNPYQGDAHTDNAMRVAQFLTHPAHLARSQLRQFRHLPPDGPGFTRLFPELARADDPWVKFYNQVMDSDACVYAPPLSTKDPSSPEYYVLRATVDQWLVTEGMQYLENVAYGKMTPHEGAAQFWQRLQAITRRQSE